MQILESDWLSYQTPSAITGICGSILADTIPPGTSQRKSGPSGLAVRNFSSIFVLAVEGRAKRN